MPTKHLTITPHAELRWMQRVDYPPVGLRRAWREAVPVGAPPDADLRGKLRLHEPADALFVYDTKAENDDHYVLKTVLVASLAGDVPTDYRTAHLKHCSACGYLWNPAEAESCTWCEMPRIRTDYDETIDPEHPQA